MGSEKNDITGAKMAEIEDLIKKFREKFEVGVTNSENFITITEIERIWGELQADTNNIYSEMIRELLSTVDERELIRKKKGNTKTQG